MESLIGLSPQPPKATGVYMRARGKVKRRPYICFRSESSRVPDARKNAQREDHFFYWRWCMSEKEEFAGLFVFFCSHSVVCVASGAVEVDSEVSGPEGVVGLDY